MANLLHQHYNVWAVLELTGKREKGWPKRWCG